MPGHTENTLKLFWSLGRRNSELHDHKQKSPKELICIKFMMIFQSTIHYAGEGGFRMGVVGGGYMG